MTGTALLQMRDGVKSFGAVRALAGASITLHEGEILGLLGDNGAGKSTLIKCLSGAHSLDSGEILFRGAAVAIKSPIDARRLGIETVYQDLALFDNLTAADNFFAGRELCRPRWLSHLGWPSNRQMTAETKRMLTDLRVNIKDFGTNLALMSGGQRQAIAVARAVAFASTVVILDEPTAALGLRESKNVTDLIRRLPDKGAAVILISHNLEEVMNICDRAVVLRHGRVVGEAVPTPDNHPLLVSLIVGSSGTGDSPPPRPVSGQPDNHQQPAAD
jgi:D-xylose transport system ATP-binding protein